MVRYFWREVGCHPQMNSPSAAPAPQLKILKFRKFLNLCFEIFRNLRLWRRVWNNRTAGDPIDSHSWPQFWISIFSKIYKFHFWKILNYGIPKISAVFGVDVFGPPLRKFRILANLFQYLPQKIENYLNFDKFQ